MRPDNRSNDALRPIAFERDYIKHAEGSVLVAFGDTRVLCAATVEDTVPPFLKSSGSGWVTAEYDMLPRSAQGRIPRGSYQKGRAKEISRLIGRSLRNVVALDALGERQVMIDCDVIQADGGTRTAAITGAYVALHDALKRRFDQGGLSHFPLLGQCAAVSVGLIEGEACLDLCYAEDVAADVDLNLVMRSDETIIEIQGCAEGEAFTRAQLDSLIDLGHLGINRLFELQREALSIG